MRCASAPLPSLDVLTQQWKLLGFAVTCFAQIILRLAKTNPQQALHKAGQLDLFLRAALLILTKHIAAQPGGNETRKDEPFALTHLKAIYGALLALMLFIQGLKIELERRVGALAHLYGEATAKVDNWVEAITLHDDVGYLDSS